MRLLLLVASLLVSSGETTDTTVPESETTTVTTSTVPESESEAEVAPEPVECPAGEICSWAVVADDGTVLNAVICDNQCADWTLEHEACANGCAYVVQAKPKADEHPAGAHGDHVTYDFESQTFEIDNGNCDDCAPGVLASGATWDEYVSAEWTNEELCAAIAEGRDVTADPEWGGLTPDDRLVCPDEPASSTTVVATTTVPVATTTVPVATTTVPVTTTTVPVTTTTVPVTTTTVLDVEMTVSAYVALPPTDGPYAGLYQS